MIEDKENKKTPLGTLGEFGLIKHLTQSFGLSNPSSKKGIGDDAAVLDFNGDQTVVSTDLLIENVHFDLAYMPLKHLGYKAVVVNLSDIYAMNAIATQITASSTDATTDSVMRSCSSAAMRASRVPPRT
jgi:thiamine-monophosphate kinase